MDLPMTQTSPAELQSDRRHTETDSTLDPPTWGEFDAEKWPHGCDGIRSCCTVTNASGTVPRVVERNIQRPAGTQASKASRHPSKQSGLAPKQARPAGTQGRQGGTQGRQGGTQGRHPRPASRQRQTSMNREKDTQTPTHSYARTPGHPHTRTDTHTYARTRGFKF